MSRSPEYAVRWHLQWHELDIMEKITYSWAFLDPQGSGEQASFSHSSKAQMRYNMPTKCVEFPILALKSLLTFSELHTSSAQPWERASIDCVLCLWETVSAVSKFLYLLPVFRNCHFISYLQGLIITLKKFFLCVFTTHPVLRCGPENLLRTCLQCCSLHFHWKNSERSWPHLWVEGQGTR